MTSAESTATDEAALLAATGAGDERAFIALYDRFSGPLYSFLVKMLRNEEDAEEILQSAFLQAWKKAASYDPQRCAPFTWLVLIARSKAIDRLRQRQRQSRIIEAAAAEEVASPAAGDGQGAHVFQNENAAAVGEALRQISAEQRQAIEMAFFKGMSQTEIADSLAEPLGTIKARIRRGLLRLRDYLGRRL